jgi:hypothetical protein
MIPKKNLLDSLLKAQLFFSLVFCVLVLVSNLSVQAQVPQVQPPQIAPSIPGAPLAEEEAQPMQNNNQSSQSSQAVSSSSTAPTKPSEPQNPTQPSPPPSTPKESPKVQQEPSTTRNFVPSETPRSGGFGSLLLLIPTGGIAYLGYFYKQNFWQKKKDLKTGESKIKSRF